MWRVRDLNVSKWFNPCDKVGDGVRPLRPIWFCMQIFMFQVASDDSNIDSSDEEEEEKVQKQKKKRSSKTVTMGMINRWSKDMRVRMRILRCLVPFEKNRLIFITIIFPRQLRICSVLAWNRV